MPFSDNGFFLGYKSRSFLFTEAGKSLEPKVGVAGLLGIVDQSLDILIVFGGEVVRAC